MVEEESWLVVRPKGNTCWPWPEIKALGYVVSSWVSCGVRFEEDGALLAVLSSVYAAKLAPCRSAKRVGAKMLLPGLD